jgi:hypothetical protein
MPHPGMHLEPALTRSGLLCDVCHDAERRQHSRAISRPIIGTSQPAGQPGNRLSPKVGAAAAGLVDPVGAKEGPRVGPRGWA